MLQAIKGYYDNGVVVLDEQPKLKDKFAVFVMFVEEETEKKGGIKI
jgi:hypothetical protein